MSQNLSSDLREREASNTPINVGLIGTGEMGTDIVMQVAQMPGIRIAGVAEVRAEAARKAIEIAGHAAGDAETADSESAVEQCIANRRIAICEDAEVICRSASIDVLIDATGNPGVGAELAMLGMEHGKHIVTMNVEADVTIGPFLKRQAERAGVVYSLGAGDEPSSTMELINFVQSLGYPIVCAGKGKNNPLRIDAVPHEYEEEASRRNMNPRMLVEFVDGSKTMIEMVAIANATGMTPDVAGMHGPGAGLDDLQDVLCPREDGGVLHQRGVVDYSVGEGVSPGVFCIAEMRHPRVRERMSDLKLGPGPYYTFYRPYHLTSLEVPLSAARAVLYGAADMQPLDQPTAEVAALAKKDLAVGDTLDKIGEYSYRGWAVSSEDARKHNALPLGLAENAVVRKPIAVGEYLTYDNCEPVPGARIVELRKRQDAGE
ncbi:hypothetical protein V5738_12050 [Salinisphaera sp. SPP-AMP-43]|uniref:NAD(P)H-dependent oxidoreductase n=1 Tax=Salinisphaera sp. SPP-AMP-43 TaxID=3121288 RepID=UPI003C6DBA96